MATLTERELARSLALGEAIDDAEDARLALHGFAATGHHCFARDGGVPFTRSHALAVCEAEAFAARDALGVGDLLAGQERGERDEQAGESERGAGRVHALNIHRLVRGDQLS